MDSVHQKIVQIPLLGEKTATMVNFGLVIPYESGNTSSFVPNCNSVFTLEHRMICANLTYARPISLSTAEFSSTWVVSIHSGGPQQPEPFVGLISLTICNVW
jgi:hypothetical protein